MHRYWQILEIKIVIRRPKIVNKFSLTLGMCGFRHVLLVLLEKSNTFSVGIPNARRVRVHKVQFLDNPTLELRGMLSFGLANQQTPGLWTALCNSHHMFKSRRKAHYFCVVEEKLTGFFYQPAEKLTLNEMFMQGRHNCFKMQPNLQVPLMHAVTISSEGALLQPSFRFHVDRFRVTI